MSFVQAVCLLGSHMWPNTRHTKTKSCLICKHLAADPVHSACSPRYSKQTSVVTWTTSMSENDLLNTGRSRVARLYETCGVSYTQSKEVGLFLQRTQMSSIFQEPLSETSVVVSVCGPSASEMELHHILSRTVGKLVLILIGQGPSSPPNQLGTLALRAIPHCTKGWLAIFPEFRHFRPVLWRLCNEGGRTSAAQLMRAGVVVHQLTTESTLLEPLLLY